VYKYVYFHETLVTSGSPDPRSPIPGSTVFTYPVMSYNRFCNSKWTIFHKIFKIFVVINQKLCDVAMWSKVGIGGEHHRYNKHNKFRQNPRGDPKFLVDLTRNDPTAISVHISL